MLRPLLALGEQGEGESHEEVENAEDTIMSFAPVEESSPLGYNVGLLNATMLNTSAMVNHFTLYLPRSHSCIDWNGDIFDT